MLIRGVLFYNLEMNQYRKHFEFFFLSSICGASAMAVSYVATMSDNIKEMTVSLQVLAEKLTNVDRTAQDHELRLRNLEMADRKPR